MGLDSPRADFRLERDANARTDSLHLRRCRDCLVGSRRCIVPVDVGGSPHLLELGGEVELRAFLVTLLVFQSEPAAVVDLAT